MRDIESKGAQDSACDRRKGIAALQRGGALLLGASLALTACATEEQGTRGTTDPLAGAGSEAAERAERRDESSELIFADGGRVEVAPTDSEDDSVFDGDADEPSDEGFVGEGPSDEDDEVEGSSGDDGEAPSTDAEAASLCAQGAPDSDRDGLCDEAEKRFGTNPRNPDSDGDSLSDNAELYGIEVDGVGPNGGPARLDLPALKANPLHRDVFVEVDYYQGQRPSETAIQLVVNAFKNAPVDNPDGERGITLHVLVDQQIDSNDEDESLGIAWSPDENPADRDPGGFPLDIWHDFQPIKTKYADPLRHVAYHYALFANSIRDTDMSGISFYIGGHDFVVSLGKWSVVDDMTVAGTFMHELGHNLGLRHGGGNDELFVPNYFSVMNYLYQIKGVTRKDGAAYEEVLDYSRVRVGALSEESVDELAGMSPGPGSSDAELASYGLRICDPWSDPTYGVSENVDFNRDDEIATAPYALDLNCDGTVDAFPTSQNDWQLLSFESGGTIGDATSWHHFDNGDYDPPTNPPCEHPETSYGTR